MTEHSSAASFSTYELSPAEAFDVVRNARPRCPVAHSNQLGGFDMLLAYDEVKQAATDWRVFSSEPSALRPLSSRRRPAIDSDPPEHTEWRKLINLGVNHTTPRRIAQLVRADIQRLIDGFAGSGRCDLISDFAEEVPLLGICHVLGVDADRRGEVRQLSRELLGSLIDPERGTAAFKAFAAFVVPPVIERRGEDEDDFLTLLANADMDRHPLTEQEIAGTMVGLLVAGHDTTVSALGSLLYEVLSRPDVRDQLAADPTLVSAAIEETLRLHPPIFGFYRRTNEPVSVGGTEIPADDTVYLCWAAANRDPEVFADADEFRLDRPRKRHLTFGFGVHACPGAPVARAEMEIALTELLRRLPTIALVDAASIAYEFGGSETMAIRSLPATFET